MRKDEIVGREGDDDPSDERARFIIPRAVLSRGSIIVARNHPYYYSRGNGHLSRREHALSRTAAYEKAPRRNN